MTEAASLSLSAAGLESRGWEMLWMRMSMQSALWTKCVVAVLVLGSLAGEADGDRRSDVPRLRWVPADLIRADTLDRVETVLLWETGRPTLDHRIRRDPVILIDDIGLSGHQHRLYFNPYAWEGRSNEKAVGIYAYDLRSGRLVGKTRIPEQKDGTGESVAVSNYTRTIYDFPSERAYMANVFPDGGHGIWRLDLTRDRPELVAHAPFYPDATGRTDGRLQAPRDLVMYPVVAPATLLLWGGLDTHEHYTISFFDVRRSKLDGPYPLPLREHGRWRVAAGSRDAVFARTEDREGFMLGIGDDKATVARETGRTTLTFNSSNVLNASQRRDVAKDLGSADELDKPVQVYQIPSMQVLARLPGRASGPFLVIPNTDVIATLPYDDRRAIRFFDLKTATEIGAVRLGPPAFLSHWRALVCDEAGFYIGAFDSYQVQLFAVSPL